MRKENILVAVLILIFALGVFYYQSSNARLNDTSALAAETAEVKNDGSRIVWTPMSEGLERAKSEDKHIFLYFYADWCTYCTKLKKTTFRDKEVLAALAQDFVSISVNTDKHREMAKQWRVTGLPSLWFLKPDGTRIGNIPGYIPARSMSKTLDFIRSKKYETTEFHDFIMSMRE